MRILILRTTNRISGAEIFNLNLFSALRGNSSLYICLLTNSKSFINRSNRLGIQTIEMPWLVREIGTKKELLKAVIQLPWSLLRCIITINILNIKEHVDLVCLQSITEKIFLTPILNFIGYKVIWIEHGPLYRSKMTFIVKWLYRKVSTFPKKIIAVSQSTKTDLIDGGVSSEKVEVVYGGVDIGKLTTLGRQELSKIKNKLGMSQISKVIGFMGTVTKEKGIEDFLDISVQLIRNGGNFLFLIIGDGPDLLWMKRQVNTLKMSENYRFVGFVENVRKYLGIIDLFLFPTLHHEGISIAMLEAQSMKKVVMTRDIGGNSEIINNKRNGYLYKKWDNNVVSRDIIKIIARPRVCCEVGKAAKNNIKTRFNINKQAKEFYRLFTAI